MHFSGRPELCGDSTEASCWIELVDEDFAGQGGDPDEAEIFMN